MSDRNVLEVADQFCIFHDSKFPFRMEIPRTMEEDALPPSHLVLLEDEEDAEYLAACDAEVDLIDPVLTEKPAPSLMTPRKDHLAPGQGPGGPYTKCGEPGQNHKEHGLAHKRSSRRKDPSEANLRSIEDRDVPPGSNVLKHFPGKGGKTAWARKSSCLN